LLLDNNFQYQPTLESLWVFGLHVETQFELHYANQIAKRALSTKAKEINKGHKYFDKHLHGLTSLFEVNSTSSKTKLSNTEKDILNLIAEGKSSQEIADERACAVSTIHTHRRNMAHKLDLYGKGELLRYAMDKKYNFE
jgi:two-component system nitrate/nitrite response regulator NarL